MSSGVDGLKQKFDALSPRERNIILVLALVVVVFLWDLLFFAPLQADSKKAQQQIAALTVQMEQQQREIQVLAGGAQEDPNRVLQRKQEQLQRQLQTTDSKIAAVTFNLIAPQQMAEVLESVLRQRSRLRLLKVTNLPSQQITQGMPDQDGGQSVESALYRHGIELLLEGEYFETMRYLKALEELPWQMVWSTLEYEVIDYPRASVRLELNTFSTQAAWIGV